jgi:hypothetical protein
MTYPEDQKEEQQVKGSKARLKNDDVDVTLPLPVLSNVSSGSGNHL